MRQKTVPVLPAALGGFLVLLFASAVASAQGPAGGGAPRAQDRAARVIEYWSAERMARAIPRDLVVDERGLGYLRRTDGSLLPYGHQVTASGRSPDAQTPLARPSGGGGGGGKDGGGSGGGGGGTGSDTTPPTISAMSPGAGAVIGGSATFSAAVTDASGVKSVSFVIEYPDGATTRSFGASAGADNTWSTTLQGFSDGNWRWWVVAKDGAAKGGNTATSPPVAFTVDTAAGSNTVTNAPWSGGAVQTAAGRLYFEMPATSSWAGSWNGYVCSGTVVVDDATARSVILTAAHCVFDDVNKAFARNVLFIPNQAGTSGAGTDLNCSNDPLGCWAPSFGVVDNQWAVRTFPDNIRWDVAFYVVADSGAHAGPIVSDEALDVAAGSLPISFATPVFDSPDDSGYTHALGYSYSEDPSFMYCAEDMTTVGTANWWLASCGLSGGSSGGPWVQPMDTGTGSGPIISVNSWGYTTAPGMAGPKLDTDFAPCVFASAASGWATSAVDGYSGITTTCPP